LLAQRPSLLVAAVKHLLTPQFFSIDTLSFITANLTFKLICHGTQQR